MNDVARIPGCSGLKNQDGGFLVRNGSVLHTMGHDDELARMHLDDAVPEFHPKLADDAEE